MLCLATPRVDGGQGTGLQRGAKHQTAGPRIAAAWLVKACYYYMLLLHRMLHTNCCHMERTQFRHLYQRGQCVANLYHKVVLTPEYTATHFQLQTQPRHSGHPGHLERTAANANGDSVGTWQTRLTQYDANCLQTHCPAINICTSTSRASNTSDL